MFVARVLIQKAQERQKIYFATWKLWEFHHQQYPTTVALMHLQGKLLELLENYVITHTNYLTYYDCLLMQILHLAI